jgi:hypothetical protein
VKVSSFPSRILSAVYHRQKRSINKEKKSTQKETTKNAPSNTMNPPATSNRLDIPGMPPKKEKEPVQKVNRKNNLLGKQNRQ